MSADFVLVAPKVVLPPATVTTPIEPAALPGVSVTAPPPEQVRAAEAYFSQQDDSHLAAGVMGLWAGSLLLHDLAVDHFEERDDIDEQRQRQRRKPE